MWYRTEEPPKKPNSDGNKNKLPAELNWFGMRLGKFGVKFPPTGAEGGDWDWERELNTQDEWEQRETNALEKEKNKEKELFVSAGTDGSQAEQVQGQYVMFECTKTFHDSGKCALDYIEIF